MLPSLHSAHSVVKLACLTSCTGIDADLPGPLHTTLPRNKVDKVIIPEVAHAIPSCTLSLGTSAACNRYAQR